MTNEKKSENEKENEKKLLGVISGTAIGATLGYGLLRIPEIERKAKLQQASQYSELRSNLVDRFSQMRHAKTVNALKNKDLSLRFKKDAAKKEKEEDPSLIQPRRVGAAVGGLMVGMAGTTLASVPIATRILRQNVDLNKKLIKLQKQGNNYDSLVVRKPKPHEVVSYIAGTKMGRPMYKAASAGGAVVGSAIGYLSTRKRDNESGEDYQKRKLRNTLIGGGAGGSAGMLANKIYKTHSFLKLKNSDSYMKWIKDDLKGKEKLSDKAKSIFNSIRGLNDMVEIHAHGKSLAKRMKKYDD